jgi:hypothetical protein
MLYIYLLHLTYTDVLTTINTRLLNHFFDTYPTNSAHNHYLDPKMVSPALWGKSAFVSRWRARWRALKLLCGGTISNTM